MASHELGQVLIATAGIARFQVSSGPLVELRPWDSMTVALGEIYWHGSAPAQLFIHTSIQAADAREIQANWLHPVTEEEYARNPD